MKFLVDAQLPHLTAARLRFGMNPNGYVQAAAGDWRH